MAKTTVTVTQTYQQVASGQCVITIKERGEGIIFFNETASDTNAYKLNPVPEDQFQQTSSVQTHVKASGDGWQIIVDGTL